MTKKHLLLLCFVLLLCFSLSAEPSEVSAFFDEDSESELCFMYLMGYEVVLQDRIPSAFMIYDENENIFTGWASNVTPSDYFDTNHSDNVTVMRLLPCNVLRLMFKALGDTSTVSILERVADDKLLASVVVFRMDKDFVFEDTATYLARESLYRSIHANGYSNELFFAMAEKLALGEEDLVSVIAEGEKSPSEVIEDITTYSRPSGRGSSSGLWDDNAIIILAVILILIAVLIILVLILAKTRKTKNN